MPRFAVTELATTRDVSAIRAVCDGCDPARPCDEHARSAWLWTVTSGAFELRDSRGRHVLDPTRAIVMPAGHEFVVRHPAGPDTCVSFRGPLIDRLAAGGPRIVEIVPRWSAAISRELANRARGEADDLALAEHVASVDEDGAANDARARDVDGPTDARTTRSDLQRIDARMSRTRHNGAVDTRASRADRELIAAFEHVLRLDFATDASLGELADKAGYSLFHACRVFRATTGQTIAGFRRELRLRHALAHILDGDALVDVADACGFASQSHLTNLFRARFRVTPARARTRDGQRQLCA